MPHDAADRLPFRSFRRRGGRRTAARCGRCCLSGILQGVSQKSDPSESERWTCTDKSELTAAVSELVEREVGRGLRRALTDEVLDNFDGHISALLLDDNQPVPIGSDEEFRITYARNYELVITIAPEPLDYAATAPVVVRNGSDEHYLVPFAISIDSNIPTLRLSEHSLLVSRDGQQRLAIPFLVEETGQKPWVWIRLTQHGRTIQNLELNLTDGGAAKP